MGQGQGQGRDRAKRAEDVNHVMMMRFMRLMRERVPSTVNDDGFWLWE